MPRGMTRTTIMSHGRSHDAKGVRGVHLRGSVPEGKVLDAIPADVGSVGNIPENTLPGDPLSTAARSPKDITPRTRGRLDAEGDIVMPGGNRDGVATARPAVETVSPSHEVVEEAPVDPADEPVVVLPEPDAAVEADPVAEDTSAPEEGAVAHPKAAALPTTKRKLVRATVSDLYAWCGLLEILPEEYVDDDASVTADLMRVLVGDKLNIKHGIKLSE